MNVGLVPHNTARSVKYFCSGYHFEKFVLDVFFAFNSKWLCEVSS